MAFGIQTWKASGEVHLFFDVTFVNIEKIWVINQYMGGRSIEPTLYNYTYSIPGYDPTVHILGINAEDCYIVSSAANTVTVAVTNYYNARTVYIKLFARGS